MYDADIMLSFDAGLSNLIHILIYEGVRLFYRAFQIALFIISQVDAFICVSSLNLFLSLSKTRRCFFKLFVCVYFVASFQAKWLLFAKLGCIKNVRLLSRPFLFIFPLNRWRQLMFAFLIYFNFNLMSFRKCLRLTVFRSLAVSWFSKNDLVSFSKLLTQTRIKWKYFHKFCRKTFAAMNGGGVLEQGVVVGESCLIRIGCKMLFT